MQTEEIPRGWVKPQRPRTVAELRDLIKQRHREIAALELELFNLQQGPRLEAIAKARNIMRAHELTIDDIRKGRLSSDRTGSLATK